MGRVRSEIRPTPQAHVANILGLLNGAGDAVGARAVALKIRLVR